MPDARSRISFGSRTAAAVVYGVGGLRDRLRSRRPQTAFLECWRPTLPPLSFSHPLDPGTRRCFVTAPGVAEHNFGQFIPDDLRKTILLAPSKVVQRAIAGEL